MLDFVGGSSGRRDAALYGRPEARRYRNSPREERLHCEAESRHYSG